MPPSNITQHRGMTVAKKHRPEALSWREYVHRLTAGEASQRAIALKTGIDQSTISRWMRSQPGDSRLSPDSVRAFAHAYGRPILEAYLVAGFLKPGEVGLESLRAVKDLATVSDLELVREMHRRLGHRPQWGGQGSE